MAGVEREEGVEALGRAQAGEEADEAADVVPDQAGALQPQGVEQGDDVGCHRLLPIAARRGVGAAEAAQVGADQAEAPREQRDQAPPLPPALRPAVQEEERPARSRLGDVEAQIADVEEAMLDTVQVGERPAHSGIVEGRVHGSAAGQTVHPIRRHIGRPETVYGASTSLWPDTVLTVIAPVKIAGLPAIVRLLLPSLNSS